MTNGSYFRFDDGNKIKYSIPIIIIREMGKLNTQSPIYCMICVLINGWVNNREAGDLRRYRAHYDVNVMIYATFTGVSHTSQTQSRTGFAEVSRFC